MVDGTSLSRKTFAMTSYRAALFGALALSYVLIDPAWAVEAGAADPPPPPSAQPLLASDSQPPVAPAMAPANSPPPMGSQPRQTPFLAKVGTGFTYNWLLNESFFSGGADLQLGGQHRFVAGGGRMMFRGGRTLAGLPLLWFSLVGGAVEFRVASRLRLGVGAAVGYLMIYRATLSSSLDSITLTAYGEGTLDLYQAPTGGALYLGLRAGVDWLVSVSGYPREGALLTIGPGYRF